VPIYGLNYKDQRDAAQAWLAKNGNPYSVSIVDPDGKVGIDYGVYGVPETFFIDRHGAIRVKHVSALTDQIFRETVETLLAEPAPAR
jgi:cytochrome c biogenesis protein CcmG/thiol:disulfide interchange protein DsbE